MTNGTQLTLGRIFGDPDINGIEPISLKFAPDGKHISYLKSADQNFEQLNLWVYDIARDETRLLVDAAHLKSDNHILPDAEKARRERLRITQTGIVEYYWSPAADALLFPLDGNLYLYHLESNRNTQLTDSNTFETDIRFSPDGQYLSFVRDQNLWVVDLGTHEVKQLTTDGGGVVSNGTAEFIAQEEMHRYEGYWWSQDGHYIAFTRVDESSVQLSQRYEIDADSFGVFDQRYPFAGTDNARVLIGIVDTESKEIVWANLDHDEQSYVARVSWLPDNEHLAIQIQSRNQQQLDLLFWSRVTGKTRNLLTETSNTWINLHNNFHPIKHRKQFIWSSEKTGFNHLYLVDYEGNVIKTLTSGDWVVADFKGIDDSNTIYFDGYLDTPLEKHLYRVSIDDCHSSCGGLVTRITESGSSHQVSLSSDKQYFIDRFSAAATPPGTVLRKITGELKNELEINALDKSHPFFPFSNHLGEVSFGKLDADDGQVLHYRLIKPATLMAGSSYPVIITVYGGPGVQRVSNTWIPAWYHYMSLRGYGLMQLDNRGTSNRGKAFENPIYNQLGSVEVADQLRGLKFLQQQDWVDANRIGVFGHSYGGYMTLMMMMKSTAFKAGISVAPVTDWSLYDTHYTERYLGHPRDNPAGYDASNVLPWVDNLTGKLLLIHGMADDNVLFSHSTKLYKALQDKNIEFEIMNYPGAKHGLAGRKTNLHRYSTMDRFFDTHLSGI